MPLQPSEFIVVDDARVAMRSFGSGESLLLLNRFRETMDSWDPLLLEALARERRVIVFDGLGIGETEGETPISVEALADFTAQVIRSLRLGPNGRPRLFSRRGGSLSFLALKQPRLVGRIILAATMPPGGAPEVTWSPKWLETASEPSPSVERVMSLFYTRSNASRKAGAASLSRMQRLPVAVVSQRAMEAQAKAIASFGEDDSGWYPRLKEIAAQTFIANGDQDGLFPAIDSVVLAREIPGSSLSIYPDSGHGFLFQYIDRFTEENAFRFLGGPYNAEPRRTFG